MRSRQTEIEVCYQMFFKVLIKNTLGRLFAPTFFEADSKIHLISYSLKLHAECIIYFKYSLGIALLWVSDYELEKRHENNLRRRVWKVSYARAKSAKVIM